MGDLINFGEKKKAIVGPEEELIDIPETFADDVLEDLILIMKELCEDDERVVTETELELMSELWSFIMQKVELILQFAD